MTQPTASSVSRVQRIIAYMIGAMVLASVAAFVVILGAAYLGGSGEFDRGVWPIVALVPLIALPLAVIGWIALLVVSLRRRALETAEQQRASLARRPTMGTSAKGKSAKGTGGRTGQAEASARPEPGKRRQPRSS